MDSSIFWCCAAIGKLLQKSVDTLKVCTFITGATGIFTEVQQFSVSYFQQHPGWLTDLLPLDLRMVILHPLGPHKIPDQDISHL